MQNNTSKTDKKIAKARVKAAKAEAKILGEQGKMQSGAMPEGIGVKIIKGTHGSDLIVSGLNDQQLQRLVPQVNKEVLITVAEDTSTVRAALMRFVREGLFQTIIKAVAGLIVGYLLFKFGFA